MNIAIVSDIHANLEALEQALALIRKKPVDHIICLGDLIGYGANPNECIALVREVTPYILLGNHDQAGIDLTAAESFNIYASASAQWTYQQVTEKNRRFISTLPYTLELENLLFVHASPYQPEAWHYIITDADARDNFDHFYQPICFVGHSHVPGIFSKDSRTREQIQRGEKYIINVGSIGQPRDGDWRLSYGVLNTDEWSYENIRSEYDVQAAAAKVIKAGLPRFLAERLLVGR